MTVAFRSSSSLSSGASRTASTVPMPAGVVAGDTVLVCVGVGLAGLTAPTVTPPTSLSGSLVKEVDAIFDGVGTEYDWSVRWAVYTYRVPSSGVEASFTFSHASASTDGFALAYSGVAVSPLDVAASGVAGSGDGGSAVATGVLTATAGTQLVAIRGSWDGNAITPPSGWTERIDQPTTWAGDKIQSTSGATGDVTIASGNGSHGFQTPWAAILVALRSADAIPPLSAANASSGHALSSPSLTTTSVSLTPNAAAHGHALTPPTLTAGAAPVITTTSLGTVRQGTAFSITPATTGGTPTGWAVASGTLPAGLNLNSSTGAITGTPTAGWSYSFTLRASNANGFDDQAYSGTTLFAGETSRTTGTTGTTAYTRIVATLNGDGKIIYAPTGRTIGSATRFAMFAHGLTDDQTFIDNPASGSGAFDIVSWALDQGWVCAASYAHGDVAGADVALASMSDMIAWADAAWTVTDIVLHGASMGGLTAVNFYAQGRDARVRGVVGIDPVLDLSWSWGSGSGILASAIRAGYALGTDSQYATKTAGYDPMLLSASVFDGRRFFLSASPADSVVNATSNTLAFMTKVSGHAAVTHYTGSGDHVSAGNFATTQVISWLTGIAALAANPVGQSHAATSPTLTAHSFSSLNPAAGAHAHQLGTATLTAHAVLVVANVGHPHAAQVAELNRYVTTPDGSGHGHVLTGPILVGAPPAPGTVFLFIPPPDLLHPYVLDPLWSRVLVPTGVTIVRGEDGLYRRAPDPVSSEALALATAVYLGGHSYPIDAATADELVSAGYGQWVTLEEG
jgi:hypothetical protein